MLLDEPYDRNNAIIELHPGALAAPEYRLGRYYVVADVYSFLRATYGYQVETIGLSTGDEAGIQRCHFVDQRGHNAYGYLKSEKGVHRLVRDFTVGQPKTAYLFCSVDVMPELNGAVISKSIVMT